MTKYFDVPDVFDFTKEMYVKIQDRWDDLDMMDTPTICYHIGGHCIGKFDGRKMYTRVVFVWIEEYLVDKSYIHYDDLGRPTKVWRREDFNNRHIYYTLKELGIL